MPRSRGAVLSLATVLAMLAAPTAALAAVPAPPAEAATSRTYGGEWSPLGGDLLPAGGGDVGNLSLAAGRRGLTLLGLSTEGPVTAVSRWAGTGWLQVGNSQPATRGSVTVDRYGQPWLCTTAIESGRPKGPAVWRWTAGEWVRLGGEVAAEAGYAEPDRRHLVTDCSGPVLDASGTPVVVWTAAIGSKADFMFAARWDEALGRWVGLDPRPPEILDRDTVAEIVVGPDNTLYVAASRPGGGYGGAYKTHIYRWDGTAWSMIGEWEDTDSFAVVADRRGLYLAYRKRGIGQPHPIEIRRLRADDTWEELPSPGTGEDVALALTRSGRLVVAVAAEDPVPVAPTTEPTDPAVPTDPAAPEPLQVSALRGDRWLPLDRLGAYGPPLGSVYHLALAVDTENHPTVAWVEFQPESGFRAHAARYGRPIFGR